LRSTKTKVLLVDDNEKVLQTLSMVCEVLNMESVCALSAVEALQKCWEEGVAVVIADVRMPEMSGFELLASLKETRPDLPVILISAYDLSPMEKQVIDEEADGFLLKPFLIDDVGKLLARLGCR
jgi:CheY-like chemotaxis protein